MGSWSKGPGKRIFDFLVTLITLPLWLPLVAGLAGLVAVKIGRPVFFRQTRPGLNGAPFQIIKFRSMTNARGPDKQLLPDEARITRFGRILRSTSLDELPELFNVLKGDMSLVGPRPLLMDYLSRYTPEQARRHEARPGITGLAQVSGRNNLPWPEVFKMDVWYVDKASLGLDVKILLATVMKVIRRKDISGQDQVSRETFTGER